MESVEKQCRIFNSPKRNYHFMSTVFKTQDQYFYPVNENNVLWQNTSSKLKEKAKALQEPNFNAIVYSLPCSPTTFQFVLDFCKGKKSFMPKSKDELEKLISFAEFFELNELASCLDKKVHIF